MTKAEENASERAQRILAMCDRMRESHQRTSKMIESNLSTVDDFDVDDKMAMKLKFDGSFIHPDGSKATTKTTTEGVDNGSEEEEEEEERNELEVYDEGMAEILVKNENKSKTSNDIEKEEEELEEELEEEGGGGGKEDEEEMDGIHSFPLEEEEEEEEEEEVEQKGILLSSDDHPSSSSSLEEQLSRCHRLLLRTRENSALKYRRLEMEFTEVKLQLAMALTTLDLKDAEIKRLNHEKGKRTMELGRALNGQDSIVRKLANTNDILKQRIKAMAKAQRVLEKEKERLLQRLEAGGMNLKDEVSEMGTLTTATTTTTATSSSTSQLSTNGTNEHGTTTTGTGSGGSGNGSGGHDTWGRRDSMSSTQSTATTDDEDDYYYLTSCDRSDHGGQRSIQSTTQQRRSSTSSVPYMPPPRDQSSSLSPPRRTSMPRKFGSLLPGNVMVDFLSSLASPSNAGK